MVGFPGESEKAFLSLMDFLDEYHPERAGFFAFSPQAGTRAGRMKDQIPESEKEKRLELALAKRDFILAKWQEGLVGKTLNVIVDRIDDMVVDKAADRVNERGSGAGEVSGVGEVSGAGDTRFYEGRSVWDAPEIDAMVCFRAKAGIGPGNIVKVRITHSSNYILTGEIANELSQ
jgi:ribosomal protein S12 methylthiotransferase